jgi:hypothetical protein
LLRAFGGDNFQIITAIFENWETLSLSVSIEMKKFQFGIFFEVKFYTFHSLPEHHKQRQNTLTTVETCTMQQTRWASLQIQSLGLRDTLRCALPNLFLALALFLLPFWVLDRRRCKRFI